MNKFKKKLDINICEHFMRHSFVQAVIIKKLPSEWYMYTAVNISQDQNRTTWYQKSN